jgi:signal peptidase I
VLVVLSISLPVLLFTSAVVVNAFVVKAYFLPSPSMEPTLEVGDRVLVNRLSRDDIHRGDIVVIRRPQSDQGRVRELIKRVVAIGGDTVETQADRLVVNGQLVDEPYISSGAGAPVPRVQVPPRHVYVLGDNRTSSSDSRAFGPVSEATIVGRAFLRIWGSGGIKRL